jgi:hypothetical protein
MEHTPRAQEMYAVIKSYLESEMTQVGFCQSRQLRASTFQYWLNRYRHDKNDPAVKSVLSNKKVRSGFIPIEISPSSGNVPLQCEIERPDGMIIRLKCQQVSADFIELLRQIRG